MSSDAATTTDATGTPGRAPGVVLVGARGYGARHRADIDRLVAAGSCTLTAVVDPALGTPTDGGAPVVRDIGAAKGVGPVDVVVVAAPIAAHLPLALAALEAGADVLLEKPPVTTRAALADLLEAERRTGRVVQVGFQSLGSHALPAFLDGSLVGRVRSAAAVGTWTRDQAYWDRSPWAGRRRLGGVDVLDGVVTNPLAHAVATALALVGCRRAADVHRVEVELYRANGIEGDDTSTVRVTTRSGVEATAALTLCGPAEVPPTVRVRGTGGSAVLHYTEDRVRVDRSPGPGSDPDAPADADRTRHFGRTGLLENLLAHRAAGAELLVPLASTGAFVEVLEAVRAAEPVRIDHPWVAWHGEGPARRPLVADVEAIVDRAADHRALFSEVDAPWAHTTRDEVLDELVVDGATVGVLLDGGGTIATSSPRPYLHPVRTLGGTDVSAHHPPDHDWHCGVGFAIPDVDGVNCWGGGTYVHGDGYVRRDDHGTVAVAHTERHGPSLEQEVVWRGPDRAVVLHEDRSLAWRSSGEGWVLTWSSSFRAPGDTAVRLGGPGSNGRVGAGYGGLFWRFPDCTGIRVRTADAEGEDAVHGSVAPWIEWSAVFEGGPATVRIEAVGHRDPWFVRAAEYPAVGSALAWRTPALVRPGVPLVRAFRATVSDGDAR